MCSLGRLLLVSISIVSWGPCAVCRTDFHIIWPLFLETNNENVVPNPAQDDDPRAAVQRIIQQPVEHPVRVMVLPDRPYNAVHPRRANVQQRPERRPAEPAAPDAPAAIRNHIRRRRRYIEHRYVRPMGRVRIRHRPSILTYNAMRCAVCSRTFHTNELPALNTNAIICSIQCYNRL